MEVIVIEISGKAVLVDAADEATVRQHSWSLCKSKSGSLYAKSAKQGALSRFLMKAPVGLQVDHRNGDTLDNRRDNLRICTHTQNQWNRKRSPGKSPFKGVSHWKHGYGGKVWRARVECNGRRVMLGDFTTPLAAALAYDDAAAKLFGKYAGLNFPERHINLGEPDPSAIPLKPRAQRRWKQWKNPTGKDSPC